MQLRLLSQYQGSLEGLRVFVRVDYDVAIQDGAVRDDTPLVASLPTLRLLRERGARLILAAHLGRPKQKPEAKYSLLPVAERLRELIHDDLIFTDDCIGDGVKRLASELKPGKLLLLENLRFHPGEEKNEEFFCKALAANADAYVDDAFGACHRAHASTAGMVKLFDKRFAGLLVEREVKALARLADAPRKPYVAMLGGARVSDRVAVMNRLIDHADKLLIGGAMAYTFLAAKGIGVGGSKLEEQRVANARTLLAGAARKNVEILLPVDHVVGARFEPTTAPELVTGAAIPEGKIGLDIGPKTREAYANALQGARTLFWNGAMGVVEWASFAAGTHAMARAVATAATTGAYAVVSGGGAVSTLHNAGLAGAITHVSTGGGAALELVEGQTLPGLAALAE